MNKWQDAYLRLVCGGKQPRSAAGKEELKLLGYVKDIVIVDLPKGTKTFKVTETECDIPNGIISVETLASNMRFWLFRKFAMRTR